MEQNNEPLEDAPQGLSEEQRQDRENLRTYIGSERYSETAYQIAKATGEW
jgi:hypothetical protein